jgi:hypothetical protein
MISTDSDARHNTCIDSVSLKTTSRACLIQSVYAFIKNER